MYSLAPRLSRNGKIGIICPSTEAFNFPRRISRAKHQVEQIGFEIDPDINKYFPKKFRASNAKECGRLFNELVADPSISCIMSATGGYNTNAILPYIDYEQFALNPKVVCGYSDTTALLVALAVKSLVRTFCGPSLLPSFGEYDGIHEFTLNSFLQAVAASDAPYDLARPVMTSVQFLQWDRDDDKSRIYYNASPWISLNNGVAYGHTIAVNLETLCRLVGTPYFPNMNDAILFLDDEGYNVNKIFSLLKQLEQTGLLKGVKALIFSRLVNNHNKNIRTVCKIVTSLAKFLKIPAIANVDCGHTFPQLTIPIGTQVKVDATSCYITILEPSVY